MVLLFMLVGGAVGWGFSLLHQPVYEAAATLNASVELNKWISSIPDRQESVTFLEAQVDSAYNSAEMVLDSVGVKDQVLSQLQAEGVQMDFNTLDKKMSIERKKSMWALRVRDTDPNLAARIANIWADRGLAAVQGMLGNAIMRDALQVQVDQLTQAGTDPNSQEFQKVSNQLMLEKSASGGLLSIMVFSAGDQAVPPADPVVYDAGGLILAGMLIGLLLSLWVSNLPRVQKRG